MIHETTPSPPPWSATSPAGRSPPRWDLRTAGPSTTRPPAPQARRQPPAQQHGAGALLQQPGPGGRSPDADAAGSPAPAQPQQLAWQRRGRAAPAGARDPSRHAAGGRGARPDRAADPRDPPRPGDPPLRGSHHRPRDRPHRPARPRATMPDRLAAQGRQDAHSPDHRRRREAQSPGRRRLRAAGGRASRGGDRFPPQHARRGDRRLERHERGRAHRDLRAGDGDRRGAGARGEGRGAPARFDHPPRARLQRRRRGQRAYDVGRARLDRDAITATDLRRCPQDRGRGIPHHHRDRAGRHRITDGPGDLRGVQGHGKQRRAARARRRSSTPPRSSSACTCCDAGSPASTRSRP
jgi:hypothetical protein